MWRRYAIRQLREGRRIITATTVAGLIITGNFAAAETTAGACIGSKPLTRIVAGGLACGGIGCRSEAPHTAAAHQGEG